MNQDFRPIQAMDTLVDACRELRSWDQRIGSSPVSGNATRAALAIGLSHHLATLGGELTRGHQRVREEAQTLERLEQEISTALKHHREQPFGHPDSSADVAGPIRDLARRSIPFSVRRMAMDWLSHPYAISCDGLAPLLGSLSLLEETSRRLSQGLEPLQAAALSGQPVDFVELDAIHRRSLALVERCVTAVAEHQDTLLNAGWRVEWLEYLNYRLRPTELPVCPRPSAHAKPDSLRRLSRKHMPERLRKALMSWALPG